MSHGKMTKRGKSLYLEKWNPSAKKYINTCVICGCSGYSPAIEQEGFCEISGNGAIYSALKRTLNKLELDESGRCAHCAKVTESVDGGD